MASLSVTNTFVAGTTILSAAMNTNFNDVITYINNRNSGAAAWERVLATNASSVPGVFNNGAGTNDILNAQDNGTNVFAVANSGNVVIGSAALLTTATDGFIYLTGGPGLPTGVPTTFTGRTPLYIDQTNNRLYMYANAAWQNAANNPAVDNSTIEINSNQLRVKDGLTIQTLNIGTALQYKTFASLPILQIVSATTATATTTASTTYVTTNLTASITPKLNTSKILVLVSGTLACSGAGIAYATIFRGSSDLCGTNGGFTLTGNNNSGAPMIVYDSPATTSSTTYSIRIKDNAGATNAIFPSSDGVSLTSTATIILVEIAQ